MSNAKIGMHSVIAKARAKEDIAITAGDYVFFTTGGILVISGALIAELNDHASLVDVSDAEEVEVKSVHAGLPPRRLFEPPLMGHALTIVDMLAKEDDALTLAELHDLVDVPIPALRQGMYALMRRDIVWREDRTHFEKTQTDDRSHHRYRLSSDAHREWHDSGNH